MVGGDGLVGLLLRYRNRLRLWIFCVPQQGYRTVVWYGFLCFVSFVLFRLGGDLEKLVFTTDNNRTQQDFPCDEKIIRMLCQPCQMDGLHESRALWIQYYQYYSTKQYKNKRKQNKINGCEKFTDREKFSDMDIFRCFWPSSVIVWAAEPRWKHYYYFSVILVLVPTSTNRTVLVCV